MLKPEIYRIDPEIDPEHETVVGYYAYVGAYAAKYLGRRPARQTMHAWLRNGYAIGRSGSRLLMPQFYELRTPLTTKASMSRWLTTLKRLEEKYHCKIVRA